jgi:hypothetical protein
MPKAKDLPIVTIPDPVIDRILNRLPETMNQGRRLFSLLAKNSKVATRDVNRTCGIVNISDIAHDVNGYLYPEGYFIGCLPPDEPILNNFGEKSNQFEWSCFYTRLAANDSDGGCAA